ncbi:YcgN family cysteine cluster protein [Marinivivus vitaminiproducens]|nr:YcgN family cysteine cluster protein [Geminicoccaceae bacterium SCSIO 64248]
MIEDGFWRRKRLDEMSTEEWESLCDGCGKCCLVKLEDEETGEVAYTDVACRLLDLGTCRCSAYADRQAHVPDCIALDPGAVDRLPWMPPSCAYRLLHEGRDLPAWHPLVSGDPSSVHRAGASARGRIVSERSVGESELEDHVVSWPSARMRTRRRRAVPC